MKIIWANDFYNRFRGLMFRKEPVIIIFPFNKISSPYLASIHSFFVFFDFYAVYLDNEGKVVEKYYVKPFTFRITPKNIPSFLIELPVELGEKLDIGEYIGKSKEEIIKKINTLN